MIKDLTGFFKLKKPDMRITALPAIFIAALIFDASCGRTINCSDFNMDMLQWVPYENNDTIRLQDTENDSVINLPVGSIQVIHATHYVTNQKCGGCSDQIYVNMEASSNDLVVSVYLHEGQITTQSFVVKGVYFTNGNDNYSEQADYTFAGKAYEAVHIFEATDTQAPFRKLYIAKGYGIIGLVDKNGHNWKLQNPELKSTRSTEVQITNTSCD